MVKPTDIELIYEFFEFAPRYRGRNPEKFNITSYVGKHILVGLILLRDFFTMYDGSRKITKHRYMHISTKTYIMHHIMDTSIIV